MGSGWWVQRSPLLARALSHKGTVGRLVCRSAIARQLAALRQGERATAGSDEGTHSRQGRFHVKAQEKDRSVPSLYIGNGNGRSETQSMRCQPAEVRRI